MHAYTRIYIGICVCLYIGACLYIYTYIHIGILRGLAGMGYRNAFIHRGIWAILKLKTLDVQSSKFECAGVFAFHIFCVALSAQGCLPIR